VADWRTRAACRGTDPGLFYPGPNDPAAVAAARAVCHTCPVRQPCLAEAMTFPRDMVEIGIWGGTSGRQRRIMKNHGITDGEIGTTL